MSLAHGGLELAFPGPVEITKSAVAVTKEGRRHGVEWAKRNARYDELRQVAQIDIESLRENYTHDGKMSDPYFVFNRAAEGSDTIILRAPPILAKFYGVEKRLLDAANTTEFVEGFVEGATDVWKEVADQI